MKWFDVADPSQEPPRSSWGTLKIDPLNIAPDDGFEWNLMCAIPLEKLTASEPEIARRPSTAPRPGQLAAQAPQ